MGRRRPWLIAAAAVLLAAGLALLLWPREVAEPPKPQGSEEPLQGAEFTDARVVGRHRGERQWVVETRILREEGSEHVRAIGIDSGTLFRDGERLFDIRAAEGRSHRVSNDLVLWGDVVAVHVDGAVMRTEVLEWTAAEEKLVAPGPVTVERDSDRIAGSRMEVDWSTNIVQFSGDVSMRRGSGEWLRAARVEYDMDSEDVWVRGPFRAGVPAERIAAGEAGEEGNNAGSQGDGSETEES